MHQITEANIIKNMKVMNSHNSNDIRRSLEFLKWFSGQIRNNEIKFIVGNVDHNEEILDLQIDVDGSIENRLCIIEGKMIYL